MRRFLLILLILIVLGTSAWYFFFRSNSTPAATPTENIFQRFFSRTSDLPGTTLPGDGTEPVVETPPLAPTSRFAALTSFPIAGYISFERTKTITIPAADPKQKPATQTVTEHFLRFVSRTNGYVYEIKDGGAITQISNAYVPNVYEAVFTPDGKTAVVRFLRDDSRTIATYSIPIPEPNPDGTRTQAEGTYFPDGIASVALSADGALLAQLVPTAQGATLITSTTKGAARKELLKTSFENWLPLWGGSTPYLQTKASAFAPGFLYRVDATNQRLVKVLGDIAGLTTSLSPKATYLLYSQSTTDRFTTSLVTMKTGGQRPLGVAVLPEKCAWLANEDMLCAGSSTLPAAVYPDAWYAGTLRFNDSLYRVYSGIATYDILDGGSEWSYDAINLSVNERTQTLYFIDKQTGLLWQFDY